MQWWMLHKIIILNEFLNLLNIYELFLFSKHLLNSNDLDHYLTMFIFFALINRAYFIMEKKKPRGGPLFDPTFHYFLKSNDYGPITINNIL